MNQHGDLIFKTHDGQVFSVCRGDVPKFLDLLALLTPDIKKLVESTDS